MIPALFRTWRARRIACLLSRARRNLHKSSQAQVMGDDEKAEYHAARALQLHSKAATLITTHTTRKDTTK